VLRSCSACGEAVRRRDCHKNRYGQYICRDCRADGVRFTQWPWLLYNGKKWSRRFFWMIAILVTVALFFVWFTEMFVTAFPWDVILRILRSM